jgi:hypothetical protein
MASDAEVHSMMPIDARLRRFTPVDIRADISFLPASERRTLGHLIDAARVIDGIFLEQVWPGNPSLLLRLAADRTPEGQAELRYFLLNKGPWSRLDHDERFLRDGRVPEKPPQAGFYPGDATPTEIDRWIGTLDGEARDRATSFFTIVRREPEPGGGLTVVPYSRAYHDALRLTQRHLRDAAAATGQPSLRRFLNLRAEALLTDDYYASDVAWMEIDATIEPTIGPYETYEDAWFGYKAAFEAFITVRDPGDAHQLTEFSDALQSLEDALPIDPAYRNPRLGALAPIRVVNVVLTTGDANRGVQTAAFNLPNDDRVVREKGSKRVMLKNVQDAKFRRVLEPIADIALAWADRPKVVFDAFFTHILLHELMHGLGPHVVTGTNQPVRLALKGAYAAIEEAKADISGLWAMQQLADRGTLPGHVADTMYTTFLASAFRSIRFGIDEAHGKGIAVQLNTFLDHGAVRVHADGTFAVVDDRIATAVAALTHDVLTIEAEGDCAAAQALLDRLGVIRPEVQQVLDRLTDVPVDIAPRFVTADDLRD